MRPRRRARLLAGIDCYFGTRRRDFNALSSRLIHNAVDGAEQHAHRHLESVLSIFDGFVFRLLTGLRPREM
jgi:hypothetical protein